MDLRAAWRSFLLLVGAQDAELAMEEQELLDWLRSGLEAEEICDEELQGLADVLCELVPRLADLERAPLVAFLIETSFALKSSPGGDIKDAKEDKTEEETKERNPSEERRDLSKDMSELGESNSSTEKLLESDSSSPFADEDLRQLAEIFPGEPLPVLQRALTASGDLQDAIDRLLSREFPSCGAAAEEGRGPDQELRGKIGEQFRYVDVRDDERVYRPPPPKYTSERQRHRFLNGQAVDTRGQKYLEVKKQEQPGQFLKAFKKYKKH